MDQFMMGAMAMASWAAGLFFLRFWRDTHDRLFLIFAVAFWLLGATRIALAMMTTTAEEHQHIYLIRLAAFVLILVAIIDKNRPRREARGS
jgi:hypothetical protein